MNDYVIIIGTDMEKAFSKGTGLYFVAGESKMDAVVKLHEKYPTIDTTLPVHIFKIGSIGSIHSVLRKKAEKDEAKKQKLLKKSMKQEKKNLDKKAKKSAKKEK